MFYLYLQNSPYLNPIIIIILYLKLPSFRQMITYIFFLFLSVLSRPHKLLRFVASLFVFSPLPHNIDSVTPGGFDVAHIEIEHVSMSFYRVSS